MGPQVYAVAVASTAPVVPDVADAAGAAKDASSSSVQEASVHLPAHRPVEELSYYDMKVRPSATVSRSDQKVREVQGAETGVAVAAVGGGGWGSDQR